jgi:hypothetical protein
LDKSRIGMICRSPRASREVQDTALRKAGAEWIIELGRVVPKSWRDVVNILCEGDIVYIYGLAMVPTKRGDDELVPSAQVREFIIEVHDAGGEVVEVSSGRSSRNKAQRQAMTKDAIKALRRGNRSAPTGRGRGRPKKEWTPAQVAEAKRVWFSRDYATNVIAVRHLPDGMTARQAWTLFKSSGRPYKKTKRR